MFHDWVHDLRPGLEGTLAYTFEQKSSDVDRLLQEMKEPDNLTICMVGSTGAGKSTLLNAILGGRILPVSSMKACTSAVTEVSYEEGELYTARIEFVSYPEWREEIALLLGDLEDATGDPNEAATEEAISISKSARDKLKAVYGLDDLDSMTLDNLRNLREPEEIREMLEDGWREVSSYDLKKFCKYVAQFLSSKHEYWPLVKTVKMKGPFEAISEGMTLVDLPGINDPNEARERVTRKYLKDSRFVWIVFNVKRGPTKDITDLMKSDDFMRQIVMDGRADAMTFVGTSSDDADVESIIEDLELDEDVSDQVAILARNEAAKKEVRATLEDLGADLRNRSSHVTQHMETILQQLKDSAIFTISSMQYMRIHGLSRVQNVVLNDESSTEIPVLKEHMRQTCQAFSPEARLEYLHKNLDLIESELKQAIDTERAMIESRDVITDSKRKEASVVCYDTRNFLANGLGTTIDDFRHQLQEHQERFSGRLELAVQQGLVNLDMVHHNWRQMHHMTIKAVARRGGRFVGTTGAHDFPGDIAKPILDTISGPWLELFGEKLTRALERHCTRLIHDAEKANREMLHRLNAVVELDDKTSETLIKLEEKNQKELTRLVRGIEKEIMRRIQGDQRHLYEGVRAQIKRSLDRAFQQTAQEGGTGMKARMMDTLTAESKRMADKMFADAKAHIVWGIKSLCDWEIEQLTTLAGQIDDQLGTSTETLLLAEDKAVAQRLEQRLMLLTTAVENMP